MYLLRKRDIIMYMKKHYYQLNYYNWKLKRMFKCNDLDLLKSSEYINKDYIENYNKKISYNFRN